jgi:hypothetical protein
LGGVRWGYDDGSSDEDDDDDGSDEDDDDDGSDDDDERYRFIDEAMIIM